MKSSILNIASIFSIFTIGRLIDKWEDGMFRTGKAIRPTFAVLTVCLMMITACQNTQSSPFGEENNGYPPIDTTQGIEVSTVSPAIAVPSGIPPAIDTITIQSVTSSEYVNHVKEEVTKDAQAIKEVVTNLPQSVTSTPTVEILDHDQDTSRGVAIPKAPKSPKAGKTKKETISESTVTRSGNVEDLESIDPDRPRSLCGCEEKIITTKGMTLSTVVKRYKLKYKGISAQWLRAINKPSVITDDLKIVKPGMGLCVKRKKC